MNKVTHFEIPYESKERAHKFYSEVFDWELQGFPMADDSEYTIARTAETNENYMIKEPGAINGGMFKRNLSNNTPKSPVITISVDSIDEHFEKVKEAGGEVLVPKGEVPEMGYYAYIKDTEGNVIGLWEDLMK
ncbi:MAG: VOC family protein [Gammaproteobacteria bacterium]